MLKYIFIFLLVVAASLFGLGYWANGKLHDRILTADTVAVEIPLNTSNKKIIENINEFGGFEPAWLYKYLLKYYAKFEKKQPYAGYYEFSPNSTNQDILNALFEGGRLKTVSVTFPEGLSIEEVADRLKPIQTNAKKFIKLAYSDSLLNARGINSGSALGYLLPETYDFFLNEKPSKVIDKMLDAGELIWTPENKALLTSNDLTVHKALTLASIVEAETPLKKEAPTVAGLYLNRLKLGMLLQADPTVQFVIGKKKRVLYKDLKTDNPYNTYLYPGLPPGPINNPGKDAIKAVLNPLDHDYLFMVAKGDGSGEHYFSKSNKGHLKFVRQYRKTKDSLRRVKKTDLENTDY